MYLIGIDIGTSGTKTVLFDLSGKAVASALYEYPMYQPKNGWAEQNPEDWWKATVETTKQVIAKSGIKASEIKGIGLSGQMHGLVMLDKSGNVIRKSIIWCDNRTAKECEEITAKVGAERLVEITGNPALTGFTAGKIVWVKNNEPQNFEKCFKILLPKDYIRFKLTGEFATEVSDASGMQLIDVKARDWSDEVLTKLGIDRSLLGDCYESFEISGKVNKSAAELTGLAEGTPVAGGGGDQAAGAVGNGIVKEGLVSATIGTSGVVFAHTDKLSIHPSGALQSFCHAVPGAYHVFGCSNSSGFSLKWFRDNFCKEEIDLATKMGVDPYVIMDDLAANVPVGSNGTIFLPYLLGERAPHLDPLARGVFFGLSGSTTKVDMIRSVMEGVAFSLKDSLSLIADMGTATRNVRASGGGGKSPLWRQICADVFGCNVETLETSEGPALGVAILAGVGTGVWSSVQEACDAVIKVKKVQPPIEKNAKKYAQGYKIYRALYPALKDSYRELAKIY